MATIPTPEESGHKILAIFGQFNIRPGEMLPFASLHQAFINMGGSANDFKLGIDWLCDMGYVEIRTDKRPPDRFFLTEDGFKQRP